jgi:gamma-glutamylcyclotransferase (GGCT)/AIG2-like uncharacterized protein YtfP
MPEPSGHDHDATVSAVFVYGTLRPGRANWPVVDPYCVDHEPAVLPGFGLYALAYPVVAPLTDAPDAGAGPPDGSGVRGDLLRLRRDQVTRALARLDAFEGVDQVRREHSYYERVRGEVVTDDGTRHPAWVYVPGDDLRTQVHETRRVPHDDWPS